MGSYEFLGNDSVLIKCVVNFNKSGDADTHYAERDD